MKSIDLFEPGPTGWQVVPQSADDFEALAFKVCQMIKNADPRIGKVPKKKLRSGKRRSKSGLKSTPPKSGVQSSVRSSAKSRKKSSSPSKKVKSKRR